MKVVDVRSKAGHKIPITVLTDKDLIFCLPIFLLCTLFHHLVLPVISFLAGVSMLPARLIFGARSEMSFAKAKLIYLLTLLCIPVILLVLSMYPAMEEPVFWAICAGYYCLSLGVVHIILFLLTPNQGTELGAGSSQQSFIPDYLMKEVKSTPFVQGAMFATVFVLANLAFLLCLESGTWLWWAVLIPVVILLSFMDKEMLEHMASHVPGGKLLNASKRQKASDIVYITLEWCRVYLVWPITLWTPNYYYCSHQLIHHVENNGPADFQSLLRYDHTTVAGVAKAVTYTSLFIAIFPVDIIRYFKARKDKKNLKKFLVGYVLGLSVFVGFTMLFPLLGVSLLIFKILSGYSGYIFNMKWHGFHNSTDPYSVEASNLSPLHYGHHKKPNIFLTDEHLLARLFWSERDKLTKKCPVFRAPGYLSYFENSMLLINACLWQQKLEVISQFVDVKANTHAQLSHYVTGVRLLKRNDMAEKFDRKASAFIGRIIEAYYRRKLSGELKEFYFGDENELFEQVRKTNFAKINPETKKPFGIY